MALGGAAGSPFRARLASLWPYCLVATLALIAAGQAQAQQIPSAGSILNGVERTTPSPTAPPAPTTSLRPEVPEQFLKQGQTAHVTRFHIVAARFPERDL